MLITRLHLLLRLRMGGAMPLIALHSCMALAGTFVYFFKLEEGGDVIGYRNSI